MLTSSVSLSRSAFTAIEVAASVAIITLLVSTSSVVTAPVMNRATFNLSTAALEDVCRQAQQLARSSSDADDLFGVVLRQENGQLWAMVTKGPQAISGAQALRTDGTPLVRVSLGRNQFFMGSTHDTATALTEGAEVGWLYRPRNGYLATAAMRSLTPTFIGVSTATLSASGVTSPAIHLGQAVSLRTFDGQRRTEVTIFGNGSIVTTRQQE